MPASKPAGPIALEPSPVCPLPPKLLGLKAVAAALGEISAKTVRALVQRGELAPPIMIGRSPKWDEKDIHEYLAWAKICNRVRACQGQIEGPGGAWEGLEGENRPKK